MYNNAYMPNSDPQYMNRYPEFMAKQMGNPRPNYVQAPYPMPGRTIVILL